MSNRRFVKTILFYITAKIFLDISMFENTRVNCASPSVLRRSVWEFSELLRVLSVLETPFMTSRLVHLPFSFLTTYQFV